MKKIIFLRVSLTDVKGVQRQEIEQQYNPIIDKFNLNPKECIIIKDKGSAYDMSKFGKREGFIKILNEITGDDKIIDLFYGKNTKKDLEIYVFDYNRLFRNTTFGILFGTIANLYDVKIYTVNQNSDLIIGKHQNSTEKSISYLKMALYSQQAEIYSENTSRNTKKAFINSLGFSYTTKGTVLGFSLMDLKGKRIKLSKTKTQKLVKRIFTLFDYYESKNIHQYNQKIINIIKDEFGLIIKDYKLSKMKEKWRNQKN